MLFLALLFLPQARIEGKKPIRSVATAHPEDPDRDPRAWRSCSSSWWSLGASLERADVRTLTLAHRHRARSWCRSSRSPGWSKQISLAQITFVGAGAFAFLQWAPRLGTIGGLAGRGRCSPSRSAWPWRCPALRLQGLYLALASMAFAQMAAILFFPQPEILGFDGKPDPVAAHPRLRLQQAVPLPRHPLRPGRRHAAVHHRAALGVVGVLVVLLHKSRFGRRLTALGDSPAACATLGVNPIVTKLGVFVISAAIAGFAGALARHLPGHGHRAGLRDAPGPRLTCCCSSSAASRW